jgi:spore maturation protein CgeB
MKKIWQYQGWENNHAFSLVPRPHQLWQRLTKRNVVVPQLKSRVFEAAFGRSLILCKRDPFNVIERYFEPGKEFVYYDEGRFKETVKEILANYQNYEPIIERAYKRAIENYTTAKFVENYLEKLN